MPLLNKIIRLARQNDDDYHGVATFTIQTRGGQEWRVMTENDVSQWLGDGQSFIHNQVVTDGPDIEYRAGFLFRAFVA